MKTILCPTDFSACADNALYYATGLAEIFKAKIIIHNSCHLPTLALQVPFEEITEDQLFLNARNNIKKYIAEGNLKGKNIPFEEHINFGLAVDNIISLAREKKIDLIVMGTKGSGGIEELLLGSNTAAVLEKAPCPCIAVPEKVKYKEIKNIVFATDYHDNDNQAISFLSDFAATFNAALNIVHVSDITHTDTLERDLFQNFKDYIRNNEHLKNLYFKLLTGLKVADELNIYLEEIHADILAIAPRKRNFIFRLLNLGLTKKITYHSRIPILAFHS